MIDRKTHQTIDEHLCSLLALVKCVDVCQLLQEIHHGNADMWLMLSSYWQFTEVLCLFILNDHSKRGFNDISAGYTHLNAYNGLYWRHVVDYRLNLLLRISVLSWLRRPSRDWTAFSSTSRWYSSGIVATTCISWMMSFKSSSASMNLAQEDGKWGHHCEPPCEYESFAKIPDTHFSGLSGNLILSSWFLYDLFSKVKIIFFTVPSSTGSACQPRANHKVNVRSVLLILKVNLCSYDLTSGSSPSWSIRFSRILSPSPPLCSSLSNSALAARRPASRPDVFGLLLESSLLSSSLDLFAPLSGWKRTDHFNIRCRIRLWLNWKTSAQHQRQYQALFFMFSSVCLF